ncbi:MAG: hypothetical protein JXR96_27505 [Deltaproteobacteria bacterium]|nr:hypothetical protein [Deltaproteobacteria bacterium]
MECDISAAYEMLGQYGHHFMDHESEMDSLQHVELVPKKTLEFSALRVCRYDQYVEGLKVDGGEIALSVDRSMEGVVGISCRKMFSGDMDGFESWPVARMGDVEVGIVMGIECELPGVVVDEYRFFDLEPVLLDVSGAWRLAWRGGVSVANAEEGAEAPSRAFYRFLYLDEPGVFLELRKIEMHYEWSCPYTETSVKVKYWQGEDDFEWMVAAHPSVTYTDDYELVDYCGAHVYNAQMIWQRYYQCGFNPPMYCWKDVYGYSHHWLPYFTATSGVQYNEQKMYYLGRWIRQYYIDREWMIDFGSYEHKFNILANASGTGCYNPPGADDYARPQSADLATVVIPYSFTDSELLSHEYNHLILYYVRPDDVVYTHGGIYSNGLIEAIAQLYEKLPTHDDFEQDGFPGPGWHFHCSHERKYCEMFDEGNSGCSCIEDKCVDGTEYNVYLHGKGFVQAFLEVYFGRSYSDYTEGCESDEDCLSDP